MAGGREAWRLFCAHWHLFEGTPSKLWIEYSLEMFFASPSLSAETADDIYDVIDAG